MKQFIHFLTFFLIVFQLTAQDSEQIIRLAKLEIDSVQLENYNAALKIEIETSVSIEPGVLTLYAVAEKNDPAHITILEIYVNEDAYLPHLETTHFKIYKSTTKHMVKSLELVDMVSVASAMKPE
jgi:quinol monooxygenase YgiN